MTIAPAFAYAQARIQARLAALPTEEEWQRLAASRTLAAFLEEARAGPMRDWVKGFSGASNVHDLESGLRLLFREVLETVARWVPDPWREAVSWTRWLTVLPLLGFLQAGGHVPEWIAQDPSLRTLLDDGGEPESGVSTDARARCLLRDGSGTVAVWVEEWHRSWPPCSRAISAELASLELLLMEHAETFRRAAPASTWQLRKELHERLRLRLHRSSLKPTIPFIFLTLTALDLERLRAALIDRALFAGKEEAGMDTVRVVSR